METIFYTPHHTRQLSPAVYAIGNFDGMHRGHQHVFAQARLTAQALGLPWGILTFEPHPRAVLSGYQRRLTPFAEKMALLKSFGANQACIVPFDQTFAQTSAVDFVANIIHNFCRAQAILVGSDFHFGPNRSADLTTLTDLCALYKIPVEAAPLLMDDRGEVISSRRIVAALQEANMPLVTHMMGRPYTVTDLVIKGDQRARHLGFPTANLRVHRFVMPQRGTYAVTVTLKDKAYNGIAHFGIRPTFSLDEEMLEVHIFDFDQNIYGQLLEVAFHTFIRPEKKFDTVQELVDQITKDCKVAQS